MGAVSYWEVRTFFCYYCLVLQLSAEALIFFGHFPGWKEQSTVQETLAAVVAEDQQAESQRWTDQHRCLVSFWCIKNFNFFFLICPYNIQAQLLLQNKQLSDNEQSLIKIQFYFIRVTLNFVCPSSIHKIPLINFQQKQ